ncbi:unnamed protein product [Phytophthora fragariaefolia]|uniref:Unnamed protein product n=1 Tax=Phytophthora fragariaefolia TaxID=1490495 RepID=A0A9W7CTL1_9STRA|nr:unnamed protein product [Phytophthora fragariaefolia]
MKRTLNPSPWFCDKCLTGQANRILDFLRQTRRVLVERIEEQNKTEQEPEEKPEETTENASNEEVVPTEQTEATDAAKDAQAGEEVVDVDSEEKNEADGEPAKSDSSEKPAEAATTENEAASEPPKDDSTNEIDGSNAGPTSTGALNEKEVKQEAIDEISTGVVTEQTKAPEGSIVVHEEDKSAMGTQLEAIKTPQPPSVQKFLQLIDSLIAEVSSKTERANLIANSTGATLVHLEKTQLVQLVEYGKREILAATRSDEEDEDADGEMEDDHDISGSNNSEVDDLIRIFDLRHQILSSQTQFERTTSALAKRTEKHLRNAETELMELEESRAVEAGAIMKVVDLISQYSNDLNKCEQKIHYNEMLLESISHRRNVIRSTNMNDRFVPAYRYSTKLMTTSSDQLLLTVLLDKLRDVTESVNEWTKMENHFEKMTSSLNKSLSLIGSKRKRTGAPVKLPPTPALFAKVKIPPSRRLIERQIANYQVNLNSIRQNRARMRKTLAGILKIAQEEHLSEEIVNMTNMLYQKCRDLKAEEEEEELRLKEEEAQAEEKAEEIVVLDQNTDGDEESAEEPEAKKPRVDAAESASDNSSGVVGSASAPPINTVTISNEVKGISSLLGSEDSDAKESNYSSAESKSRADNDDDSEGDLEQASRAIADITSSVLPDIPGGDARLDLLNSPPMTAKPAADVAQGLTAQGQFSIRGGTENKKNAPKVSEDQKNVAVGPSEQSFLDQALEVLNKQQQQQQRLDQERVERQRQLEQQQKQLEEQQHLERQHRLEQQRQLEQQRLEQQRQDRERQERERQERERRERGRLEKQRLERQRIEKQRQEQERREQQRREQQRLEQERREQQRIEQQRIEDQRRMEEQLRLEEEQHRLEQQRLEQQRLEQQRLEQQRLEQQRLEQQRLEQQRQEKQRQEQQRLEHQRLEQQRLEQQRLEKQRQEQQRQEQQRRQQEQQRLELQRRQQEQRQEQQHQFQRNKAPNLPQVVQPGSSHLQMLSQQHQQQLQQQQALQQQQHSRQMQHPLYGDMPKGMMMSSGMGASQEDMYVQQAAQMGMEMHDVVRHQDSGHFVGSAPGGMRGAPYDVSRSAGQQPAPTAPRTSFYGDDGQGGQMHSQDVFGSQGIPDQQRQMPDHHMFANDLQQQPGPPQSRGMVSQDFLMSRSYRDLDGNDMQHPGLDQPDNNDVNMGDWGQ